MQTFIDTEVNMKQYEYHTLKIAAGGVMVGGKFDVSQINQTLNNMGMQGWELVNTFAAAAAYGHTRDVICIFKREVIKR